MAGAYDWLMGGARGADAEDPSVELNYARQEF